MDKDSFTRLLDLALGWGEYVEQDETEHPDGVRGTDIYAAYQVGATFAEPYWEAAPEVQEMAVRHFVDTRLLPLLLGIKSSSFPFGRRGWARSDRVRSPTAR